MGGNELKLGFPLILYLAGGSDFLEGGFRICGILGVFGAFHGSFEVVLDRGAVLNFLEYFRNGELHFLEFHVFADQLFRFVERDTNRLGETCA